ncbi:MAG TPA: diaminopimelate decarboxylase [Alphaproteobacteria bacterium]|nr:diaminopimelate decarboxylase [Alphaproteobacteria bacterium]
MYQPSFDLAQNIKEQYSTPVAVISKPMLEEKVKAMKTAFKKNTKIFYAIKANNNPHIVNVLKNAGIDGIDTVSINEVKLAKKIGFTSDQIIYTGSSCSDSEMTDVHNEGVMLNIGSTSELARFGKIFPNTKVSIRFNPQVGDGETAAVITAGDSTKFGIKASKLDEVKQIVAEHNLIIAGIHCHIGSGFYTTEQFEKAVIRILDQAKDFANLEFIDFGGGFGVQYKKEQTPIDLNDFAASIEKHIAEFNAHNQKEIEVRLEPGKYLVMQACTTLTSVTTIKDEYAIPFVGTDTGMNHIIRPALYGSYHHVENLSKLDGEKQKVNIVGNICESDDFIAEEVEIQTPAEGDLLAVLTTGAYCPTMQSFYNLRAFLPEVLVDEDNSTTLIRKRMNFDEMINQLGFTDF